MELQLCAIIALFIQPAEDKFDDVVGRFVSFHQGFMRYGNPLWYDEDNNIVAVDDDDDYLVCNDGGDDDDDGGVGGDDDDNCHK